MLRAMGVAADHSTALRSRWTATAKARGQSFTKGLSLVYICLPLDSGISLCLPHCLHVNDCRLIANEVVGEELAVLARHDQHHVIVEDLVKFGAGLGVVGGTEDQLPALDLFPFGRETFVD